MSFVVPRKIKEYNIEWLVKSRKWILANAKIVTRRARGIVVECDASGGVDCGIRGDLRKLLGMFGFCRFVVRRSVMENGSDRRMENSLILIGNYNI